MIQTDNASWARTPCGVESKAAGSEQTRKSSGRATTRLPREKVRDPHRSALATLLAVAISAMLGWHAPPAAAQNTTPDTTEQRLKACALCHGDEGEGIRGNEYYPRLAGKPAGYLFNQLYNFRELHRPHEMMSYMVRFLSDDYLREMAEYYAALKTPYPPPKKAKKELIELGEKLVTKGDPSRKIPACAACHGKKLTGMEPAIPGLIGLNLRYIYAQMGAWQTGRRKAHAPDCMGQIAQQLNAKDISAVSAWLAAQTASPNDRPLPANSLKLPMECGGLQ